MMTADTAQLLQEIADTAALLAAGGEDAAHRLEELIGEAEALGLPFFDPGPDTVPTTNDSGSFGLPF